MYIFNLKSVFLFLFVLTTIINLTFAFAFEPTDKDLLNDNQKIKQSNTCKEMANCQNVLSIQDFKISKEESPLKSDKIVIQVNKCNQDQLCVNSANMVNDVFEKKGPTENNTTQQNLYQSCGRDDGPICLNTNNMFVDVSKGLPEYK